MTRQIFHVLDGMRGIAALAVVERHKPDFLFGAALPASYLAVDLFFMLSGFVIAHAYEARLRQGLGIVRFTLLRLIRLMPLHLAAMMFSAALFGAFLLLDDKATFSIGSIIGSFATGALILPTPEAWAVVPDRVFPLNDPAWSLFFELGVNIVFAAILPLLSLRMLVIIALCGIAGFSAVVLGNGNADVGFAWDNFTGGFPRVTFGFFVGVLLYRVFDASEAADRDSGGTSGLIGGTWGAWAIIAIMAACFALPCPPQLRWLMELTMIVLVFPGLVLAAASITPGPRATRLFALLGAASYGIYVFHLPAARAFKVVFEGLFMPIEIAAPWVGAVFIALLVAFALCADRWFDRPVRRWLTARLIQEPARAKALRPAFHAPRAGWLRRGTL